MSQPPAKPPPGYRKTSLEERASKFDTGAPVTGAVAMGNTLTATFGDGTVRFFDPSEDGPAEERLEQERALG